MKKKGESRQISKQTKIPSVFLELMTLANNFFVHSLPQLPPRRHSYGLIMSDSEPGLNSTAFVIVRFHNCSNPAELWFSQFKSGSNNNFMEQ